MFHLQFLFCTRMNVLFLPCIKAGPLRVNRNTEKQGTVDTRTFFLMFRGKDLKKNSKKHKINALVKWKQSLKTGDVYFAKREQNAL